MPSQPAPWTVYTEALTPLKFGDALWEPGPIYSYKRVRPGDVGYVRRGRFHLLFSAGIPLGSRAFGTDVPLTFEPLDVGPIMPGEVRPPGHLRTSTVRQVGVDVGGSVAVAHTVEPGAKIAFELTSKQGATLITKHPTYREDVERERRFVKYIKQHYESWVDFARELDHPEDARPILVTGVDLTREFAMVAYSDNQSHVECEFSAALPGVASTSVSVWGSWHTAGLVHTNCGPHPTRGSRNSSESSAFESEIPDEYTQCVFIRYYTIRKRFFFPTVFKAGAGPHQLPKGDSGDGSSDEEGLQVSSVDDSMEIDLPETGSPRDTIDEVIHNVPTDDHDNFDIVAEFIFRRSDAKSVLLHHDDIQDLLQGDEEELARLLAESGTAERIDVDENGVGQLRSPATTGSPPLISSDSRIGDDTYHQITPDRPSAGVTNRRPPGRDDVLFSFNRAIEALNLAEDNTRIGIALAKSAFGSVSILLTMIKDSMVSEQDYVELGLSCADICRVLDQVIKGKKRDDLSQPVCEAIDQFTTTVAEIQRKVISRRGQSENPRLFRAKSDPERIPAWKLDLNRIFHVFNSELGVNASSGGIPDQESNSLSRASSVSPHSHSHYPPSPSMQDSEPLRFHSPHENIDPLRRAACNARRIYVPGSYISCSTGIFAGHTIRAEVNEIQKANVGRKWAASKDRRALDPPPVTELRIYVILDAGNGTTQETELDYRGLQPNGLICHVELFEVSVTTEESPDQVTDFPVMTPGNPSYPRETSNAPTVEAYWRNQPITAASNHTSSLEGDLFTQALNLPIGRGKNSLLFVFADLSVKMEGWFLFRYRVFDLFSVTDGSQPILAECWGRPFRVYATKHFPGLEPSTELTKLLHSHHVPVRMRDVRRKRKKNSNDDPSADSDQDRSTTP